VRAERYNWNPSTGDNDLRSPITPEAQGEGFVRFALGDIPPWRWLGLEITVRIKDGMEVGSALANRVMVSSDVPDDDLGDNRAGWVFETQAPGPNLRVRKWLGNGEPCVNCGFEYEIEIVNDGTEPAFNVVISDTLPAKVEYQWNQWWGDPTDPTLPLDPNITSYDLLGLTVAEAAQLYGESAGGTGFDLADVGVDWIQYVKFTGDDYKPPEVDAVADVLACGDYKHPFPDGDINQDCRINIEDISLLAQNWLRECQGDETYLEVGDVHEDCSIDMLDFAVVASTWLDCSWECQQ